ncbi:MAG: hypothetical protein WAW88_00600 [Nocardioides sp.]
MSDSDEFQGGDYLFSGALDDDSGDVVGFDTEPDDGENDELTDDGDGGDARHRPPRRQLRNAGPGLWGRTLVRPPPKPERHQGAVGPGLPRPLGRPHRPAGNPNATEAQHVRTVTGELDPKARLSAVNNLGATHRRQVAAWGATIRRS